MASPSMVISATTIAFEIFNPPLRCNIRLPHERIFTDRPMDDR